MRKAPSSSSRRDTAPKLQQGSLTAEAVLNVPKLADVLSPPPRPGTNRKDYAVVALVWLAHGFMRRSGSVDLGSLTRVQRGERGLEGIGVCALSGIVSVSWNVSLVSESSSESVTKTDSLGKEQDWGFILLGYQWQTFF